MLIALRKHTWQLFWSSRNFKSETAVQLHVCQKVALPNVSAPQVLPPQSLPTLPLTMTYPTQPWPNNPPPPPTPWQTPPGTFLGTNETDFMGHSLSLLFGRQLTQMLWYHLWGSFLTICFSAMLVTASLHKFWMCGAFHVNRFLDEIFHCEHFWEKWDGVYSKNIRGTKKSKKRQFCQEIN